MCGKPLQRRFNLRGDDEKHVLAYLSASKDEESSFDYSGSPVKLVQAFMGVKLPTTPFLPLMRCYEACASLFICQH